MVWVILPAKSFEKSKQRLASVLNAEQRQYLAEAMLRDVLQALTASSHVEKVLVVTADATIAELASLFHAEVYYEGSDCRGLNHAVDLAVSHAELHGAESVFILHADIPLITTATIDTIIRHHFSGTIALVPDKQGTGTNGLLMDLPNELEFHYGENSFQKHLAYIQKMGIPCEIEEWLDLTLDIDSPEDLLELEARLHERPLLATAECLQRVDMQQAILRLKSGG